MADKVYARSYRELVGADFTSDPACVEKNRLAYSVNMWRDYDSENGAAIETFPGFRRAVSLSQESGKECGRILNVYSFRANGEDYLIIHATKGIFALKVEDVASEAVAITAENRIDGSVTAEYSCSLGFVQNNRLYIISNLGMSYVQLTNNGWEVMSISEENLTYIPTTYYNGERYEQRNMLTNYVYQVATVFDEILNDDGSPTGLVRVPICEKALSAYNPYKVFIDSVESSEETNGVLNTENYGTEVSEICKICENCENGENCEKQVLTGLKFAKDAVEGKTVKIMLELPDLKFRTIETGKFRSATTLDYKGTSCDAILGCTKATTYDGRVFLTGNPELPNTVFYSSRNSTGANDPTYFGVYNYFNDGYGEAPNVEIMSSANMLMVFKQNTTRDGSVYYHVGSNNGDSESRDLLPRIYPSTSGSAGVGSVATLESQGRLSYNFLDDPVFLSHRGLEGISKRAANLNRTVAHRSGCVDRLLTREHLSSASITEWKGYLVICCNGHAYLADSRSITRHDDGSYQYEWFYLEGLVTRGEQTCVYSDYLPKGLDDYRLAAPSMRGTVVDGEVITATVGDTVVYYVEQGRVKIVVEPVGYSPSSEETDKVKSAISVGERLFLMTDTAVCVVNTDMQRDGKGRLPSRAYSFDGCRYLSGCSFRLDDCDMPMVRKNTAYGSTVARFKSMPNSRCEVRSSQDGVNFSKIYEVSSSVMDFGDMSFRNASFASDADHVAVIPERSRGWVRKQYYFCSDGMESPFGIYELSFAYSSVGKIRY